MRTYSLLERLGESRCQGDAGQNNGKGLHYVRYLISDSNRQTEEDSRNTVELTGLFT